MDVDAEDLKQRYERISTADLRELARRELTPEAAVALREVLVERASLGDGEDAISYGVAPRPYAPPPLPWLWPGYAAAGILLLLLLLELVAPRSSGETGWALNLLVGFAIWLYWLACVYRLHQILAAITGGAYPISPGAALGRHFIPFYGLYWFVEWPAEIVRFLNDRNPRRVMAPYLPGLFLLASMAVRLRVDGALGTIGLFATLQYLGARMRPTVEVIGAIEELGA